MHGVAGGLEFRLWGVGLGVKPKPKDIDPSKTQPLRTTVEDINPALPIIRNIPNIPYTLIPMV